MSNQEEYLYRTVDSFTNAAGFAVTVFERRKALPKGGPDMSVASKFLARVNGTDEMIEVGSIALAGVIMADKTNTTNS